MTKSHFARSTFLRLNHYIRTAPIFLFLLPVFFVLHGFIPNYEAVYPVDALRLTFLYFIIAIVLGAIGWIIYHDILKAAILAFILMAYHFFFGVIQDVLIDRWPNSFVTQFRFLLPLSGLLLLFVIIWLKRRKKPLPTLILYLNAVFILLILIDTGSLLLKMGRIAGKSPSGFPKQSFTICDSCKKPDVYFILLDQYTGNMALKEVFNFDNVAFETQLGQRGFHIAKRSSSNYNLTPFSMASTLNMDYLSAEMGYIKHLNVTYSYNVIRNSLVIDIFKDHGYKFYNLSVFDFPGQPAHQYGSFLPYGTDLITAQTFTSRIKKALKADILSGKIKLRSIQEKIVYEHLHFNDDIFQSTKDIAAKKDVDPKFVYAHFIMPHWPYYYDSSGNKVPIEKLQGFRETTPGDYISYLQYANKKILELVDYIRSVSVNPPAIILLGDHGFRNPQKRTEHKYDFSNLNAILLPNRNYQQFTDNMTNVNFFRVFFNSCFNQRFGLLKDSTINLWK